MEEEGSRLLVLFDFFWFRHHVLLDSPIPAVPLPMAETAPADAADAGGAETSSTGAAPPVLRQRSALRRTLSDDVTLVTSSDSALLARRPLKLQTILSGKDAFEEEAEDQGVAAAESRGGVEKLGARAEEIDRGHRERRRKHRERRKAARGRSQDGLSKSLSELEFEELKGFMDLGFTFTEAAESDQRLLSIVPGLRRRASSEEGVAKEGPEEGEAGAAEEPAVSRPYLSEAWAVVPDYQERRKSSAHDHLLRNWRVPAAGEGVDMKDHLRSWAHTVASTVR